MPREASNISRGNSGRERHCKTDVTSGSRDVGSDGDAPMLSHPAGAIAPRGVTPCGSLAKKPMVGSIPRPRARLAS
eukprot:4520976-Pyramimonas_sp.AAC.1